MQILHYICRKPYCLKKLYENLTVSNQTYLLLNDDEVNPGLDRIDDVSMDEVVLYERCTDFEAVTEDL